MTRLLVRRRGEPVEAVQWHKPGDHPAVRQLGDAKWFRPPTYPPEWNDTHGIVTPAAEVTIVAPGNWLVAELGGYRVLTPEQFAAEYERVE